MLNPSVQGIDFAMPLVAALLRSFTTGHGPA